MRNQELYPKVKQKPIMKNWEMIRPELDINENEKKLNAILKKTIKQIPDPRLYPIGQMHGTYIFAQNEKGLYIIDQHAAQERLKYEYFREKVGKSMRNSRKYWFRSLWIIQRMNI